MTDSLVLSVQPPDQDTLRPCGRDGEGGDAGCSSPGILSSRLADLRSAMDQLNLSLGLPEGRRDVPPPRIEGPPEVRFQKRIACMRETIAEMRGRRACTKRCGDEQDKENTEELPPKKSKGRKVTFAPGPWKEKYKSPDGHPNREGIHKPQSLGREFRTCHEPRVINWTELSELVMVLQKPPEEWGERPWDPARGYEWSIRRLQEQKGILMKMPRGRPFATPQPKVQARKEREHQWRKLLVSSVISRIGTCNKSQDHSSLLKCPPVLDLPGKQQVVGE